jgi:hypothetical protein
MKKYVVHVKEIYSIPIKVYAVDKDDALAKASSLDGEWLGESEFETTTDISEWVIEACDEADTSLDRADALNQKIDELKLMLSNESLNKELLESGILDLQEEIVSLNNSLWIEKNEINDGEDNAEDI